MKIKFVNAAPGRPEYEVGKTYDFKSEADKTYARKYIERGWAVEIVPETGTKTGASAGGGSSNQTSSGGTGGSAGAGSGTGAGAGSSSSSSK